MDTQKARRSRAERLFGVRRPLLYLGLSVLWLVLVVASFFDPSVLSGSWGPIAVKAVMGALSLGMAAIAILNIVMQRRGLWFREEAPPLAQESDPSLRQTR